MDNKCKICGETVSAKSHFWKTHKIKESSYYETYFPRFDIYDKSPIKFKNSDSYFLTDFNNKINLKKYLESRDEKESLNYLTDYLKRRKEHKNLTFAPGQFELRSLTFPSVKYINTKYEEEAYKNICLSAGLSLQYSYSYKPEFYEDLNIEYVCDSREQNILKFSNMEIAKLDFGDYSAKINGSVSNIIVERKSLNDAISTLSSGIDRFKREIDRCIKNNIHNKLIILIEEKYENLASFSYLPHLKFTKCNEDFIFHRIRELLTLYPLNIQFLAVNGRGEAVRVIDRIFKIDNINIVDLQFLYDKKLL